MGRRKGRENGRKRRRRLMADERRRRGRVSLMQQSENNLLSVSANMDREPVNKLLRKILFGGGIRLVNEEKGWKYLQYVIFWIWDRVLVQRVVFLIALILEM
jgi:hypothetical protein